LLPGRELTKMAPQRIVRLYVNDRKPQEALCMSESCQMPTRAPQQSALADAHRPPKPMPETLTLPWQRPSGISFGLVMGK
jgi:hypothetical protein